MEKLKYFMEDHWRIFCIFGIVIVILIVMLVKNTKNESKNENQNINVDESMTTEYIDDEKANGDIWSIPEDELRTEPEDIWTIPENELDS